MKRIHFISFFVALLMFSLGSALAQDDEGAIEDFRQQWEDLFNEGDIEGVAEFYTEDAILYDSSGQVHEGRDAIQEGLQSFIDAGFTEIAIQATEIEVLIDTAYLIASHTLTNDEGETLEGYSIGILQRENGEWRLYRHLVNVVQPQQDQNGGEGQTGEGG